MNTEIEKLAGAAAEKAGYPKSDKEQFTATYWTLHDVFVQGFVAMDAQKEPVDVSAEDYIKMKNLQFNTVTNEGIITKENLIKHLKEYASLNKKESEIKNGFLIREGDEVNSILIAALRTLTPEQLVVLRDNLIARTPKSKDAIGDKNFLSVLEENYEAAKDMTKEDKKRPAQDMVLETYEDLIAIYKANYVDKLKDGLWINRWRNGEIIYNGSKVFNRMQDAIDYGMRYRKEIYVDTIPKPIQSQPK